MSESNPIVLSPRQMLEEMEDVNVLAPLVRCSKLPFRHLVSMYETHITHTPMILAPEFSRSQTARISDFTTSSVERGVFWMKPKSGKRRRIHIEDEDKDEDGEEGRGSKGSSADGAPDVALPIPQPAHDALKISTRLPSTSRPPSKDHILVRGNLIAQFAANDGKSLADACELINVQPEGSVNGLSSGDCEGYGSPPVRLVDGVDINCGCPQSWAYSEGIGSALLRKPELVADMIKTVHARMGNEFGVSVKIRVDPDLKLTERLVQTSIHAGITHLTIHGRTRSQPSTHPVSLSGIESAVDFARGEVPCVGNGDIWDIDDAHVMRRETGVVGVMAARGLLANPALFAGYPSTPKHAVENFVDLSLGYSFIYPLFQRHISYMLEGTMQKYDRLYLNSINSHAGVVDWLQDKGLNFGYTVVA